MKKELIDFCKQNKYIELNCDNCGTEMKKLSKKVLSKSSYIFVCPKCNKTTEFRSTDLENLLKKIDGDIKKRIHR